MKINVQAIADINEAIPCTVSGTDTDIVLTPDITIASLDDGMKFYFVPDFTVTTTYDMSGFINPIINIEIDGFSSKVLKAPDAYSYALAYDIQKDKPTEITYIADQDVFVLSSPPLSFRQSILPNGKCKLQAASSTGINLTQEDGQSLLMWNATTESFRPVSFPLIVKSSLFTSVNYYEGSANQALPTNKLIAVYGFNKTATNDQDVDLDHYRMNTGVGAEAWTPIISGVGTYTKRASIGSLDQDNSRHYLGMMWTGSSDISPLLTGTTIRSVVLSHYNPWPFVAQTDVVNVTGFTSGSTSLQSTPQAIIVTEGIQNLPFYEVFATYKNSTVGCTATLGLSISGTQFDGQTFSATSYICEVTNALANKPNFMHASWGVAVPMGVYTVKPILTVDAGTASFDLHMKVHFAL